jgi:predicted amidohydrolase
LKKVTQIHPQKSPLTLLVLLAIASSAIAQQSEGKATTAGVVVRVASISFVPKKFDLQGNADRLEQAVRKASLGGAEIAVAPEGALDGYVVNEIIAGKVPTKRMNEVAIPIDHRVVKRFQDLARELELCIVFGFAERIGEDVFNSAVFIDHHGKICGKYHKMQFAEGYHASWWFNRLEKHSRAFDTPYGRCGIMICNDRWNPQLAKIPVLDGARFLVIPAFGSRSKSQDQAVLNRAKENGIPIVEANVGVTLVVDGGKIVAVDRHEEGITFGQITIPAAIRAKPKERDDEEQAFLKRREKLMKDRYRRTLEKLKK